MTFREFLSCAPDSPLEAAGDAAAAVMLVIGVPLLAPRLIALMAGAL